MPQCAIPGCNNVARHNLGIRLRRPDTTAIWAPNTKAFLCDAHAEQGMRITVVLEPTNTGIINTRIVATDGNVETRRTRIRHEA